jgi:hypothetical protein
VLTNPEPKVSCIAEVLLAQLVLLDFQPAFQDLFGFGTAHGDVDGDLFVAADPEGADCVAGFAWGVLVLFVRFVGVGREGS